MTAWGEGVLAGYGIAIPVGAIAILIIEMGLRRGFRLGFMAGAGLGALVHRRLSPRVQMLMSIVGNLVVIGLGARILLRVLRV